MSVLYHLIGGVWKRKERSDITPPGYVGFTDNGDGTWSAAITDNGNGTWSASVADNGDGTWTG